MKIFNLVGPLVIAALLIVLVGMMAEQVEEIECRDLCELGLHPSSYLVPDGCRCE